jgi:adenosylcobinamide-phosphate synthase
MLDRLLGEPRRLHPLVGFGRIASWIRRGVCPEGQPSYLLRTRSIGLAAWCLAVLPWVLLVSWLATQLGPVWRFALDALALWFALGAQSLVEHARRVAAPLAGGDLGAARERVALMVSRDTSALDANGVARASVESVLENGNDAVFATLFWFFVLGAPGALLHRLANTLDAMWGYRTPALIHFGWAAARIDDVMNWLPARLTALTYAALGRTRAAILCWRAQAPLWESPNAGPVMAAGAGALGVALGGPAIYHGRLEQRPALGAGDPPVSDDIERALGLVRHGMVLWLTAALILAAAWGLAVA